ncbi:hypothetical protein [Paludibacterium paludis]|nr:hypothetical protein [Paludibacterium paludis]
MSIPAFLRAWPAQTANGLSALYRIRAEYPLALVRAVVNLVMFPFFSVVVPVWVKLYLHGPASYIGLFDGAFGAGMIVCSWGMAERLGARVGRIRSVCLGFVLPCAVLGAMGAATAIGLAMAALPDSYRSRVSAAAVFVSTLFNPLGVWLAGFVLEAWSLPAVLSTGGWSFSRCCPLSPRRATPGVSWVFATRRWTVTTAEPTPAPFAEPAPGQGGGGRVKCRFSPTGAAFFPCDSFIPPIGTLASISWARPVTRNIRLFLTG